MKKSMKIVSILMMAIMMLMVATPVFASSEIGEITIKTPEGEGKQNVLTLVGTILGFLRWGAVIGGVILITIIGIKYMMGSLEEKAEYKKTMVPLVVGIIVVMGATFIAKMLFDAFTIS